MKPTAATYSRVSLPGQADNFSLPSQRRAMLKLASEKGYMVPPELQFTDEGGLGGEIDRPGLTSLRAAVRSGAIQAVIVYDPDRLSRKLIDLLILVDEFERHNATLVFVNGSVDATPEGKAMLSVKGIFSELEKAKLRERTMRGRREKAMQGFVPSGRVAYGYRYEKKTEKKPGELVIDPAQAEVVRRIFGMAAAGERLLSIARRLTGEGVRPRSGGAWRKTVLSAMLRNPTYTGLAIANKKMRAEPEQRRRPAEPGKSKKTSYRARPQSEWITVKVPAIVSRELFDRVQKRLSRDRHIDSGRPSTYILRGLIKCGACGFACCVNGGRGQQRYWCNNYDRLTSARKCDQPSVLVADIEAVVWDAVTESFESPARVWELMNTPSEAQAKTDKELQKERAALMRDIEKLKRREFRAAQGMLDADLRDAHATFRADLKATQAQRRSLEARLTQLQPAERPLFDLDAYCREVASWRELQDPEARREKVRQVVERVELKDRRVTVRFRLGSEPDRNCTSHQVEARLVKDLRTFPLRIGAKEDRGSENPLKGADKAPVLRAPLLQPEDVEHLGSTLEGNPPTPLANRQRGEKDRDQPVLSPRQAIGGMTGDLKQELSVTTLMQKASLCGTLHRQTTEDERSRGKSDILSDTVTLQPDTVDRFDLPAAAL
jgi:site-specific DNA recombinase